MTNKWIWLDMDGTIADLYGVNGWLDDLQNQSVRPYAMAKLMYNMLDLLTVFAELKILGYNIGVISWGAKNSNKAYDCKVAETKKAWIVKNDLDLLIDKVIVTPYGVCKADTCRAYGVGILVDDEKQNRDAWDLGDTIDANKDILKALWGLVKED